MDQIDHQWRAHPGTGRLRDHLRARLEDLQAQVLGLAGPRQDPESRLVTWGAVGEVERLVEYLWGADQ